VISKFNGINRFLSNFHPSNIESSYGIFPSAEHLFQSAKTNDTRDKERIRLAYSPGRAKRMGRNVLLRSDWEEIKFSVMERVVMMKFTQNEDLAIALLETGYCSLVEGNKWHDNEWGNCTCRKCLHITGRNILGKILMQVRENLRGVKELTSFK